MEQDETGRDTESAAPRRMRGGYWAVFVSPLSLGTKASLDYDQASSREIQSVPTHTVWRNFGFQGFGGREGSALGVSGGSGGRARPARPADRPAPGPLSILQQHPRPLREP